MNTYSWHAHLHLNDCCHKSYPLVCISGFLPVFVPTVHLFNKSAKAKPTKSKASPSTRQQYFQCFVHVFFLFLGCRMFMSELCSDTQFSGIWFFLGHIAQGQYNRSLLDNAAFRLTFALLKSCQQQKEGGRRSRREGTRGRKG